MNPAHSSSAPPSNAALAVAPSGTVTDTPNSSLSPPRSDGEVSRPVPVPFKTIRTVEVTPEYMRRQWHRVDDHYKLAMGMMKLGVTFQEYKAMNIDERFDLHRRIGELAMSERAAKVAAAEAASNEPGAADAAQPAGSQHPATEPVSADQTMAAQDQ